METTDATLVELDGGLLTVTLNRPKRKNAINADNWADLAVVMNEAEMNPDVRAVVLTGRRGQLLRRRRPGRRRPEQGHDRAGRAADPRRDAHRR